MKTLNNHGCHLIQGTIRQGSLAVYLFWRIKINWSPTNGLATRVSGTLGERVQSGGSPAKACWFGWNRQVRMGLSLWAKGPPAGHGATPPLPHPLRVCFLSKEGRQMVKQSQCTGLGQVLKPWPWPAMGQVAESKVQWPFSRPLGVCWRIRAVQRRLTVSALWPALWQQRKERYLTQRKWCLL